MKTKPDQKRNQTDFTLSAPEAKCIFLSGDFNHWDASSHPMKKAKNGVWKISLNLAPGPYQYRFVVDGRWENDPGCHSCIPNPFGTDNCLKIVQ